MQESHRFASALPQIGMATRLLTVHAFVAGWATGLIGGANATDRFAVGMVFIVRNVGIATACFLAQVPLLLASAYVFRRLTTTQVDTETKRQ